jgi:M6 family metalloprotease-like protein
MSAIFGEILTFGQPSGTEVRLKVSGDEHYARYENLNGYTAVYDTDLGLYCYAGLASGVFQSTGVPVTEDPPPGVARHLQEPTTVIAAKSQARRFDRAAVAGGRADDAVVRVFGPNNGLLEGRILSTGTVVGLTILVNFADVRSTVTRADVDDMLNGANYTRNGNICSAREYFDRVSSGKLDYTNVVVGPYTLSRNRQFYVNNLLVKEALDLAVADGLDLTQFDSRGDKIIDALNVMYAGQTQYIGDLWPHNSNIALRYGGMATDLYLLTSLGRSAADLSIGTFCHENGHLLCRFPDMYDYGQRDGDNITSAGIGSFCLMGSGNHLDSGRSPAPVCAYLRDLAGWCDIEIDLATAGTYNAKHGDYNTVMKYRSSRPSEYFLIENRVKAGLDRGSPASGLAVYHCDTEGSNELQQGTAARHYQCALLQADGRGDMEANRNQGDGADLFGAIQGVALTADSSPHTREWNGRDSGLVISDIQTPGLTISFTTGAPAAPPQFVEAGAEPLKQIPRDRAEGITSSIVMPEGGIVGRIAISADVEHPDRSDLQLTLTSPTGRRAVLHSSLDGEPAGTMTFDSATPGTLTNMIGQPVKGTWMLTAVNRSRRRAGKFHRWHLALTTTSLAE